MKSSKIKYILYILIVLSSLSFYNPYGVMPGQMGKLFFYSICLFSIIYAYNKGINLKKVEYPRTAYKMLIFGIIISILMVVLYQKQSLSITSIATLPYILGYLTFYVLMKFNIPKEKLEKAIWVFCYIGMAIYIVNMITFPNMVFGIEKEEYDMSRGIVRIGVRSIELIVLLFLYSINQWMVTKKKKYIWLISLSAIFIVLSVTRQVILLSAALGLLFILKNASIGKKITTIGFCIFFYFVVLPEIPIYKTMVELSETQVERNNYKQEDIRIRAWRFYTYEYQTNNITPILGNGVPSLGNSFWGNEFGKTVYRDQGGNGCYGADVGWAGFYWNFGLFATLGLFIILLKAILKKKQENKLYLTYWCIYISLTSIASGPILYYHQIISIVTVLYLVYGRERVYCNNHPQLQ